MPSLLTQTRFLKSPRVQSFNQWHLLLCRNCRFVICRIFACIACILLFAVSKLCTLWAERSWKNDDNSWPSSDDAWQEHRRICRAWKCKAECKHASMWASCLFLNACMQGYLNLFDGQKVADIPWSFASDSSIIVKGEQRCAIFPTSFNMAMQGCTWEIPIH